MYIVSDNKNKIVAFHKKFKVVQEYVDNIDIDHGIELSISKVHKKDEKYLNLNPDLELEYYDDIVIQTGYIDYLSIVSRDFSESYKTTKSTLISILKSQELSHKDEKAIIKSIEIVDKIDYGACVYTPTLNELQMYRDTYYQYVHNKRYY